MRVDADPKYCRCGSVLRFLPVEEILALSGVDAQVFCDICRKDLETCSGDRAFDCATCEFALCSECFAKNTAFVRVGVRRIRERRYGRIEERTEYYLCNEEFPPLFAEGSR